MKHFSNDKLTQKNDKLLTLDLVLFSHCANNAISHNVIKVDEEIDFIRLTLLEGAKVRELTTGHDLNLSLRHRRFLENIPAAS